MHKFKIRLSFVKHLQHSVMYIVLCTVYSAQCKLPSVHCAAYIAQRTLHSLHYTAYIAQPTLHSVHCTAYIAQRTLHSVHCTAYIAQRTLHSVQCTAYSAQCTVYSAHFDQTFCDRLEALQTNNNKKNLIILIKNDHQTFPTKYSESMFTLYMQNAIRA